MVAVKEDDGVVKKSFGCGIFKENTDLRIHIMQGIQIVEGLAVCKLFVFGNGKYRGKLDKKYPDRLALKSEVLSKEEVKETIREANGGVWDQKLEVWWTPKMENGKLTYQATTNINLKAEK